MTTPTVPRLFPAGKPAFHVGLIFSGVLSCTLVEPSPTKPFRIYRFGAFELSERDGELRKNGIRIKLQEQPFRILLELLANPGQIVTREDLQQKLWPADTFVDFDVGLNTAMRKLRQALNDDADRPRYIETASRRGYRLLVPVEIVEPRTAPVAVFPAPTEAPPREPTRSHRTSITAAVVVFALVSIAFVAWRSFRRSTPVFEKRVTANTPEAPIMAAAISPDGRYVAYSDPSGMYLRSIDTGETHPYPMPKGFWGFPNSWFPDSTHFLLTARSGPDGEKHALWKVSVLGGTPQVLLEDAEHGVVSPDGSQIAFFRRRPGTQQIGTTFQHTLGQIWLAGADGQNVRELQSTQPGVAPQEASAVAWSPNGRYLAYVEDPQDQVGGFRNDTGSLILVRDLHGGAPHQVLRDNYLARNALAWGADGRLFYAVRGNVKDVRHDDGVQAIAMDPNTGKETGKPQNLTHGIGWIGEFSITSDGKRLALWRGNSQSQVYVSQFDQPSHLTAPRRLTLDQNINSPTTWTPDGRSVLFLSDRDGQWKLFRQDVDEEAAEPVVEGQNINSTLPRLSADGADIVFAETSSATDPEAPAHVMRIPVSGGVAKPVFTETHLSSFLCARTPSTTCVYARIVRGVTTFFRFDTQKGKGAAITKYENEPNWGLSPDGSQLAVITDDRQGKIQFVSLADGSRRDIVVKGWPVLNGVDWAASGNQLLMGSFTQHGTTALIESDLDGNAHSLLEGDSHLQFMWAIPSPDGHHVALDVVVGENNVWVVENL